MTLRYSGIEIKIADDMRCCNSCYARNYDEADNATGKRVDRILTIKAGQTVISVCDECAQNLVQSLGRQIKTKE